jgi:hypothetical protein
MPTTLGEPGGKNAAQDAERPSPIILDLGKKKRKSVKQLLDGKGKLLDQAMNSIEELQRVGSISQSAQPVIVIIREKPKSNRMFPLWRA